MTIALALALVAATVAGAAYAIKAARLAARLERSEEHAENLEMRAVDAEERHADDVARLTAIVADRDETIDHIKETLHEAARHDPGLARRLLVRSVRGEDGDAHGVRPGADADGPAPDAGDPGVRPRGRR